MRTLLALIAISSTAAAGCGDDAGGSLSRGAFSQRVEEICKDRQDAVKRDSEAPPKIFDDELEAYGDISPPADLERQWSRYVDLMRTAQKDYKAWTQAAQSRDPDVRSGDAFHLPYARWQRNGAQARKTAKAMGLTTCGEAVY